MRPVHWPDALSEAAVRIRGKVRVTPCLDLEAGAFDSSARLSLKLECLQHTGSFKPRGAFNALLSAPVPAAGVVAASGGNHGAAVAFAARELGHPAAIFVPESASPVKVERLRAYGARVEQVGTAYADALAASERYREATGAMVVHAYDQLEVVAGQGTLGHEITGQCPDAETVLVAVGGGGLIGGITAALGPSHRIVAVETEGTATLHRALEQGKPVDVEVSGVAADALGARRIGDLAFDLARAHSVQSVVVTDEAVREARAVLWESLRLVTEPAGAATLAALMSGAYRPADGERVVMVICGANTDPAELGSPASD